MARPATIGRRTYQVYCAPCHGANREGDPAHARPALHGVESRFSRAAVTDIIQKGRGVMPPFANLTDAERNALVAYLFNDVRPARSR